MLANIEHDRLSFRINLDQPIDISIPMSSGNRNPNAFGIQPPVFEPFRAGGFVGSVSLGGSVNCENLLINAHGNGTHTECVGHISHNRITIHESLTRFMFLAQVVSVEMKPKSGDRLVTLEDVKPLVKDGVEALVIRTVPNMETKCTQVYSGNNPGYLEPELCRWLCEKNVMHLLIDLPSVDREEDGGELAAHHAFWNYPESPRMEATITEMAFIPDSVQDGMYMLNLQIASLQTDASPSKPVLYKVTHVL